MTKENLLWKLDLLESQLRKDPNSGSRLTKTKYAVEKERKKELSYNQLEQQIVDVKRKLVDRKIYHGVQALNRGLKKELRVEMLKIQKRIKNSKEDKLKIKAHNEELDFVKNKSKNSDLASTMVMISIFKSFLKNYHKTKEAPSFLSEKVISDCLKQKEVIDKWNNSEKNVYGRLGKSSLVKTPIQQMIISIKVVGGLIDKRELKAKADYGEVKEERSKSRSAVENGNDNEHNNDGDDDGDDGDDDDFKQFDDDEKDHLVAGSDEEEEEDERRGDQSKANDESDSDDNDGHDNFFASSTGDLPTLATGYISGSDDDEDNYDYDNDKTVKSVTTERKNRRGQRARRKIWEMKYGSKANHVQQEREQKQLDYQKRQKAFEIRQARRAERQIPEREPYKPKPSFDDKPLHPSWEAKKKISSSAKFEGKKITF